MLFCSGLMLLGTLLYSDLKCVIHMSPFWMTSSSDFGLFRVFQCSQKLFVLMDSSVSVSCACVCCAFLILSDSDVCKVSESHSIEAVNLHYLSLSLSLSLCTGRVG